MAESVLVNPSAEALAAIIAILVSSVLVGAVIKAIMFNCLRYVRARHASVYRVHVSEQLS